MEPGLFRPGLCVITQAVGRPGAGVIAGPRMPSGKWSQVVFDLAHVVTSFADDLTGRPPSLHGRYDRSPAHPPRPFWPVASPSTAALLAGRQPSTAVLWTGRLLEPPWSSGPFASATVAIRAIRLGTCPDPDPDPEPAPGLADFAEC